MLQEQLMQWVMSFYSEAFAFSWKMLSVLLGPSAHVLQFMASVKGYKSLDKSKG